MLMSHVENFFGLSPLETNQIEHCVKSYAQELSLGCVAVRLQNAVQSLTGNSQWQDAKQLLANRVSCFLSQNINKSGSESAIENQALLLSEFLLTYFVTKQSLEYETGQFLIPRDSWHLEGMDRLTLDDIVKRTIEEDFPLIEQSLLIQLTTERQSFECSIHSAVKRVDSSASLDANSKQAAMNCLDNVNKEFKRFSKLINDDAPKNHSLSDLNAHVKKLKDLRAKFNGVVDLIFKSAQPRGSI